MRRKGSLRTTNGEICVEDLPKLEETIAETSTLTSFGSSEERKYFTFMKLQMFSIYENVFNL